MTFNRCDCVPEVQREWLHRQLARQERLDSFFTCPILWQMNSAKCFYLVVL